MKRLFHQGKQDPIGEEDKIERAKSKEINVVDKEEDLIQLENNKRTYAFFGSNKISFRKFSHSLLLTKQHIMSTIENASKYSVDLINWIQISCICCYCCCRKRRAKIQLMKERFAIAQEKLYYDLDLLENIKAIRAARFTVGVVLKKY